MRSNASMRSLANVFRTLDTGKGRAESLAVIEAVVKDDDLDNFFLKHNADVRLMVGDHQELSVEEFLRKLLCWCYPLTAGDIRNMRTMYESMAGSRGGAVNKVDYFDALARGRQRFGYEIFGTRHRLFRDVEAASSHETISWVQFLTWLLESFVYQYQNALKIVYDKVASGKGAKRRGGVDPDRLHNALLKETMMQDFVKNDNSVHLLAYYRAFFSARGSEPVGWEEFKEYFFRDPRIL